jgi:hypothetical protein
MFPTSAIARFFSVLLMGLACATGSMAASCFSPPAGMLGWWPGDGDASDLVHTNGGSLLGGATANTVGMVGSAFLFDGTNAYVQVPDVPLLRPTNLTVEAWVRFDSLDSPGNATAGMQYIVFRQNTSSVGFEGFTLTKARSAPGDHFSFQVTSATGQSAAASSTTLISTGLWYHVAGVRGSNFIQIFVNGHLEAQLAVSFAQVYGDHPLLFGTTGVSYWDRKFKGALDEVALYDHALSTNEIASL